ncbi:MAG: 2-dehydro-3-deoxygalactonokinase [Geminicoccaceae bacterium]
MQSVSGTPADRPGRTALIGVDWGTSSLRAYLMDAHGQILDTVHADKGILHIEPGRFAAELDALIGAWRAPDIPVILSGMIGSRQGWIEVPYLDIPATFDEIGGALVRHPDDPLIHLVPGLARDPADGAPADGAPDVMRGEETQIVGVLGELSGQHLLVMPGTHSKWVFVENGRITWFATFMTGELFAVLRDHSILGRLIADQDAKESPEAFSQGLTAAKTLPGGLLQRLFSARTLGLFERISGGDVAAYLSGLLIGSEIDEALSNLEDPHGSMAISVIGGAALSARYRQAIEHAGLDTTKGGDDAAARGHYLLAKAAMLLPVSTEPMS